MNVSLTKRTVMADFPTPPEPSTATYKLKYIQQNREKIKNKKQKPLSWIKQLLKRTVAQIISPAISNLSHKPTVVLT